MRWLRRWEVENTKQFTGSRSQSRGIDLLYEPLRVDRPFRHPPHAHHRHASHTNSTHFCLTCSLALLRTPHSSLHTPHFDLPHAFSQDNVYQWGTMGTVITPKSKVELRRVLETTKHFLVLGETLSCRWRPLWPLVWTIVPILPSHVPLLPRLNQKRHRFPSGLGLVV